VLGEAAREKKLNRLELPACLHHIQYDLRVGVLHMGDVQEGLDELGK
jgi:hypothetical protein